MPSNGRIAQHSLLSACGDAHYTGGPSECLGVRKVGTQASGVRFQVNSTTGFIVSLFCTVTVFKY